MDVEARKRSLRYLFAKVVEPLGYKFTPDEERRLPAGAGDPSRGGSRKPVLPVSGTYAESRREHEDRMPVHPIPSGAL